MIAAHEASHIVCGLALGLRLDVAMVHQSEGLTRFGGDGPGEDAPWLSVEQARAMIATAYAGIVGEEQLLGGAVLGASWDVSNAQRLMDRLAASGRLPGYPMLPSSAHSGREGNDGGAYFAACAALAATEHERARRLVAEHEAEIRRVADAILRAGHVTMEDLPAILEGVGSLVV